MIPERGAPRMSRGHSEKSHVERYRSPVSGNSAETFFSKGKSKSLDATLARMTKWVGIVFVALTLVLSLVK